MQYTKNLVLGIVFLLLGIVSLMSIMVFFIWGAPLGFFFGALGVWFLTEWFRKRKIPFSIAYPLFLLAAWTILAFSFPTIGHAAFVIMLWPLGLGGLISFFWLVKRNLK